MPGVTISASYGAGGSVVAPAVAQRLGLPFLDRAISTTARAHRTETAATGTNPTDSEPMETEWSPAASRSFTDRVLALLSPLAGGVLGAGTDAAPAQGLPGADAAVAFRGRGEAVMRAAFITGAVVLGRAGSAAFRHEPDVLRVWLTGPAPARIVQGARIEQIDQATARRRLREVDDYHEYYVRRLYDLSVDDPTLFHLQLDSTALPLNTCADLIATAYRSLTAADSAT